MITATCLSCRRFVYLLDGPGSTRLQVGLTTEQKAELDKHSAATWKAQQLHDSKKAKYSRGSSSFIGVSVRENGRSWRAMAITSGGRKSVTCPTEEEAARAYDKMVLQDQGRCVDASSVRSLTAGTCH